MSNYFTSQCQKIERNTSKNVKNLGISEVRYILTYIKFGISKNYVFLHQITNINAWVMKIRRYQNCLHC